MYTLGLILARLLTLPARAQLVQAAGSPEPAAQTQAGQRPPAEREPGGGPLAAFMSNWLKSPILRQSQVGVEIIELPSGRLIYSFNGSRRFTPASTAKVFTCACAFDTLGSAYLYHTDLVAYGPIKKDRLAGDLVLVLSQDPTLDSANLGKMLSCLESNKIRYIEGAIELAPVAGGGDQFNPGWLAEDWGQEWMPVSSDFVLDHNIASGRDPGRGLAVVTDSLENVQHSLFRTVLLSDLAAGWVSYDQAGRCVRVCRSSQPSMSAAAGLVVANPDQYNLAALSTMIKNMGIRFSAHPTIRVSHVDGRLLGTATSKPLSRVIYETLKESDNLYAQQILRTLGARAAAGKGAAPASIEEAGLAAIRDWLSGLGVASSEVVLVDGCGLSRKNCITPHALNVVLKHMAGTAVDGPFLDLLRMDGNDSTFFRFKTGAMDSVRAISGVIRSAGGSNLAATIMVNGHTPQVGSLRGHFFSLVRALESMPALTGPAHGQSAPAQAAPAAASAAKPAPSPRTRTGKRRHKHR